MIIKYQEIPLSELIDYYVKGFEAEIESHEYFLDTQKQKLVLKLFIEIPDCPDCDCGICGLCTGGESYYEKTSAEELYRK